jgi:hypothetical protein
VLRAAVPFHAGKNRLSLLAASVPAQAGYRCYWLGNTMYCN